MESLDSSSAPIVEERLGAEAIFEVAIAGPQRVRLLGELDITGVPLLRAGLASMSGDIEIDCSGLTFIDCSGLRVLENTHHACQAKGVHLYLIGPSRCVTRLLELTGLAGFFDIRAGSGS